MNTVVLVSSDSTVSVLAPSAPMDTWSFSISIEIHSDVGRAVFISHRQ